MILVDANLLLYAGLTESPHHERARSWLDNQLSGTIAIGLPWSCLLAFVRIATSSRIVQRPVSTNDAWLQVEAWLDVATVWIPQPTDRHRIILGSLLRDQSVRANLVTDAHLATLAIEHGLTLCSADRDFARFGGLRWENPLASN